MALGALQEQYDHDTLVLVQRQDVPPSLKYTQLEKWEQRDQFPLLICPTWDDVCGSQGSSYLHANSFDWQLGQNVGYIVKVVGDTNWKVWRR